MQDEAGCHEKLFPSTVTLTSLGLAAHTAQWLKMFTAQTARELELQNPHRAGSCRLTSTGTAAYVPAYVCCSYTHAHAYMYTHHSHAHT